MEKCGKPQKRRQNKLVFSDLFWRFHVEKQFVAEKVLYQTNACLQTTWSKPLK